MIINDYYSIQNDNLKISDRLITLDKVDWLNTWDYVLILQTQHSVNAWIYEYNNIIGINWNEVKLKTWLKNEYFSNIFNVAVSSSAQLVRVPIYQNLQVNTWKRILAKSWDSKIWWVIAFKVIWNLKIDGAIIAQGVWFRWWVRWANWQAWTRWEWYCWAQWWRTNAQYCWWWGGWLFATRSGKDAWRWWWWGAYRTNWSLAYVGWSSSAYPWRWWTAYWIENLKERVLLWWWGWWWAWDKDTSWRWWWNWWKWWWIILIDAKSVENNWTISSRWWSGQHPPSPWDWEPGWGWWWWGWALYMDTLELKNNWNIDAERWTPWWISPGWYWWYWRIHINCANIEWNNISSTYAPYITQ